MGDFRLYLSSRNHGDLLLDLFPKDENELMIDYYESVVEQEVYNDDSYILKILSDEINDIHIDNIFINDESIIQKNINVGDKIFEECFGLVRIEIIIDDNSYVTDILHVMMSRAAINQNLVNMIDYIYNNCDDYLYEEHKHSKSQMGIKPNSRVSIDSKICLLEEISDTYLKCFHELKYSSQSKIVCKDKIASINELQVINSNTIKYIINHPDELRVVNYNSGIYYNKQHYQPQNTLVQSVSYSYDIYENQVIVGFIKTVINELGSIRIHIVSTAEQYSIPEEKYGYVKSSYYIFTKNTKVIKEYLRRIDNLIVNFQNILSLYQSIFLVKVCRLAAMDIKNNFYT